MDEPPQQPAACPATARAWERAGVPSTSASDPTAPARPSHPAEQYASGATPPHNRRQRGDGTHESSGAPAGSWSDAATPCASTGPPSSCGPRFPRSAENASFAAAGDAQLRAVPWTVLAGGTADLIRSARHRALSACSSSFRGRATAGQIGTPPPAPAK